jgi:transposase
MAAPEVLFPQIEGTLATIAGVGSGYPGQSVALFVKLIKEVMLSGANARATDWAFTFIDDIDETSAATATAPETGAVLYGLVIGQQSADASEDYVAVCDDSDGTIAAFAHSDTRFVDVPKVQVFLDATASDGVEEFTPFIFPKGVLFASYMSFVAEGEDGTNPATSDIRAWAVYRTGTTRLQA